jgi:hypothetical protein
MSEEVVPLLPKGRSISTVHDVPGPMSLPCVKAIEDAKSLVLIGNLAALPRKALDSEVSK